MSAFTPSMRGLLFAERGSGPLRLDSLESVFVLGGEGRCVAMLNSTDFGGCRAAMSRQAPRHVARMGKDRGRFGRRMGSAEEPMERVPPAFADVSAAVVPGCRGGVANGAKKRGQPTLLTAAAVTVYRPGSGQASTVTVGASVGSVVVTVPLDCVTCVISL